MSRRTIDQAARVSFKPDPVNIDMVVQSMQAMFKERVPWLDVAFGRGFKFPEHLPDGGKFIVPKAYIGGGDYASLLPNDRYGNFCWFDIYDPQEVDPTDQGHPLFKFNGAVVFWYDQSTIFPDSEFLRGEELKQDVLVALTKPGYLKGGRLTVREVSERPENIYKGYSLEKIYNSNMYQGQDIEGIDKQYFVYPFGGFRIEFYVTFKQRCQNL